MGLGDEIMVTGEVRRLRATDPRKVRVLDRNGAPRWWDLWEGNPGIAKPGEFGSFQIHRNGGGCRPYIDYRRSRRFRWAYTDWRCTPGELFGIKPDSRGEGLVLIEPELKSNASPNKQWGQDNWLKLSKTGHRFGQMCPPGQQSIPGVERIETKTFQQACGVLMAARALVLPEGGLHHAAAALGLPAIVLFGACTSPRNTGYDMHINLAVDDPDGLGWRIPDPACQAAWKLITPELVLQHLETSLG